MFSLKRILSVTKREAVEILQDPIRLVSFFVIPVFLMIIFGYGLTLDIENVPFKVLNYDNSLYSLKYTDHYINSEYYDYKGRLTTNKEAEQELVKGKIRFFIEIPRNFSKNLLANKNAQVGIFVDGTVPFRAETIKGYVEATHFKFLERFFIENLGRELDVSQVSIEPRYWYNQTFESKNTFVPGTMAMIMMTFAAILVALSIVREKELGTISNFYATPLSSAEFIIGKQLIYILICMIDFMILTLMSIFMFGVVLKGSFLFLLFSGFVYICSSTSVGILISSFSKTQIASLMITLIVTTVPTFMYSGMMNPISSMSPSSQIIANLYPVKHFFQIILGLFTKDLPIYTVMDEVLWMAVFTIIANLTTIMFLKKQEK